MKKKELEELVYLLTSILDTVPFDLWLKDINGKYKIVNKQFEKYTEKPREEIIGRNDYDLYPKEEADIYAASDKATLVGCVQGFYTSEYKKGRFKEEFKKPLLDREGNLIGSAGFCRDITEMKNVYDALKESERSKTTLLSNLPGVAYRCKNNDKWTITYFSEGCYELTGYTAEELVGNSELNYYDLIDPEYRETLFDRWKRDIELGRKSTDEYPITTKSGAIKWVWEQSDGVFDDAGNKVASEGFITDITQKKLYEKALKQSEERFRAIYEKSQIGIGVFDSFGRKALYVNQRFTEIIGRSAEELLNLDWVKYTHSDDAGKMMHMMDLLDRNQIDSFTIDRRYVKPDDSVVWANLIVTSFFTQDDSKPQYLCMLNDITAQKQAEAESLYLNNHDQLTGLYNRRYYDECIKSMDTEKNLPITLAMADVNGLKLTNDAFGHIVGDQMLMKIGNILKRECRANDIAARIGGDEFVLLLPNTSYAEADKIIQRIQNAIQKEDWGPIICSLSFGLGTKRNKIDEIKKIYMIAEDHMYRNKLSESRSMRYESIKVITESLYRKNEREQKHCERVSDICGAIGNAMGLSSSDVSVLKTAGLLHDIGKIGVDEKLLNKAGALTVSEWEEMKSHAETGYYILSAVNEFATLAEYVLCHHERLDGKGYPRRIKGNDIPIQSKIISLADSYDAMTSPRSYKNVLTKHEAIREIQKHSGTQFDPDIAKIFIEKVLTVTD